MFDMSSTKVKKNWMTHAKQKGGSDSEPPGNKPVNPADGNPLGIIEEVKEELTSQMLNKDPADSTWPYQRENSSPLSPHPPSLSPQTPESTPQTSLT